MRGKRARQLRKAELRSRRNTQGQIKAARRTDVRLDPELVGKLSGIRGMRDSELRELATELDKAIGELKDEFALKRVEIHQGYEERRATLMEEDAARRRKKAEA